MRGTPVTKAILACAALILGATGPAWSAKKSVDKSLQIRLDAVRTNPKEPRNHYNLGLAYYYGEMYEQARAALQQALKVNRKDKEAHAAIDLGCCQLLGDISLKQKKFSHAVKWFGSGLKINPRNPVCLFGKGQAFYLAKKTKAAQKAFEQFLAEAQIDEQTAKLPPQALTYLGAMTMDRAKYEEAAGYFRQVIEKYPKQSKEAAYNLSLVLMTQGDLLLKKKKGYDKVAPFYDEAAAADPTNASALRSSALIHYYLGTDLALAPEKKAEMQEHFVVAERNFKRALKLESNDFQSTYTLGLTQYKLERFESMISSYKKSVELDPQHPGARFNLALALYRNKNFEEAVAQAEMAKKLSPRDKHAAQLVANVYDGWKGHLLKQGTEAYTADRILEAIAFWKELLSMDPRNPEAKQRVETAEAALAQRIQDHTLRGNKAYEEGNIAVALEQWQAAAALDPESETLKAKLKKVDIAKRAAVLRKQANVAYKLGDYQTALAKIEAARKVYPTSTLTKKLKQKIIAAQSRGFRSILAKAKKSFDAGQLLAARKGFEQARDLSPKSKTVRTYLQKVAKRIEDGIEQGMQDGLASMRAGNKEKARQAFERVLSYDPGNPDAARQIKKLTGKESQTKLSADKFKELYKKGLNAYLSNDLKTAEEAWAGALKIDPDNREVEKYLDRVRLKLRKSAPRKT